jgi:hypothetical protein
MGNQIFQVFRTYYTRRDYWIFAICMLIGFLPLMGFSKNAASDYFLPVVCANVIIGCIVGMQMKLQFARPQARLLPGFNAVHLIVPAIIITAAILLEVCIANVYSVPYFAFAAYTLFFIAAASWNAMRGYHNFLFMVFMFASMFLPKYFVAPFLTSGIFVSVATFCIGFVALAALGVRIMMLCEEMPEYAKVMPGSVWDFMSRASRRDRGKLEAQMIARSKFKVWLQDIMFLLVFKNKTALNPPRRFMLRRLATGFSGVFIAIFLFISIPIFLCFPRLFLMSIKEASVTSFFMIMLLYLFIIFIRPTSGSWLSRWEYLVRESLFPISRRDFAHEMVRNGMFDIVAIAVGFFGGTIVGLAASQPERLLSGSTPLYIAVIIAQIFMVGCAMLFLASYRSFVDIFLRCYVIVILSMVLIFSAIFGNWLSSSVSIVATAAGSVGFYRLAFRRWCDIDLD